jgi:tetratricopeptide (TPR) repeat protein
MAYPLLDERPRFAWSNADKEHTVELTVEPDLSRRVAMATFAEPAGAVQCGICLENIADAYELDCAHKFCRACINEYKKHGVNDVCPYCRAPLPPGFEYSIDQCHQLSARIMRYISEGDTKRVGIAHRLQLHHAQKAVNADPSSAAAHFYLALGMSEVKQDHDGAILEFRKSIRIDPNKVGAHLSLGALLSQAHDDAGAMRAIREAIRCAPDVAEAHYNLGLLMYKREDFDNAEHKYRTAIRCDPNYARAHGSLGVLLFRVREDLDGAEREYREAIRCDANYAIAYANLGVLLFNYREDHDGAELALREAIRCNPANSATVAMLQTVLDGRAEIECQKALRCGPKNAQALAAMACATNTSELRVGLDVVLVGLASAKFNGARGTIASGCKDGRWGVKLPAHGGKVMAIKTENISRLLRA